MRTLNRTKIGQVREWLHPLLLLIVGGPIIDILSLATRESAISASALVRTGLLIVMLIAFLRAPYSREKRRSIYLLILCGLFFAAQALLVSDGNLIELAYQITRMWYFPLFLIMMMGVSMSSYKKVPSAILIGATAYALVIVFATLLGLSLYTYDNAYTQGGAVGWFYAGNEVGCILAVGALLAVSLFARLKRLNKMYYFAPLLIFIAIPLVGTKVALAGAGIAVFISLSYLLLKKEAKAIKRVMLCATVFAIALMAAPSLQQLAVRNASAASVDIDSVVKTVRSTIFSGRVYYLEQRSEDYSRGDVSQVLLGRGDYSNGSKVRVSEMDPFDIIFANGLIGLVLYLLIIIPPIRTAFTGRAKSGIEQVMLRTGVIMLLVLSVIGGHIIVAPAVCIILVGMIYYLNRINREHKEKIAI